MGEFVHLHLHTEYSLLDGLARIKKGKKGTPLKDALAELGMTACAITDHGNMCGVYNFVASLQGSGIKPIIGSEFYTVDDIAVHDPREERNHLVLLAKNQIGYQNLMILSSISYIDGFYYRPRIDMDVLAQHSEGLICLTGCIQGRIPQLMLAGDYEGAKAYATRLKSMFAEGDLYFEIQYHAPSIDEMDGYSSSRQVDEEPIWERQRRINPMLQRLGEEMGVKLVATNDVHYLKKEDADLQDVLMCINMQKKITDANRIKMEPQQFYLKSYDEMLEAMPAYREAIENTVEIANKCNVEVMIEAPEGEYQIPAFIPRDEDGNPLNVTNEEYLRNLAYEGLPKKYPEITETLLERMEHELEIIIKMGFAGYYLIVWDFIRYSKSAGIPVGPGRGSGVGSLVAYCIGITNVDPIKYSLLFERFLNPERISMPDFDIDFCIEGRGDVIKYVTDVYHPENVSQIIAFGTLSARAAVKDVARAYDIPYNDADRWAKAIPMEAGKSSLEASLGHVKNDEGKIVGASPDFIAYYNEDPTARNVIDVARKLEGMPRQTSMHAAGVLICPKPVVSYLPLQRKDDSITTQFDKDQVEHMGLVKMDFLGLRTLTDIALALDFVKKDFGVDIDFDKLGVEDPEVYKEISSGDTVAIFQLESAGMCKFMTRLRPDKLEEVIAGVSLYRPGPMQFIDDYVGGKYNPEGVHYLHPMLKPILDVTYGCIVYQEQVMQIAREIAGYSFGEADELRRAMGKKKLDVMREHKEYFIRGREQTEKKRALDGAIKRGMDEKTADELFEQIREFANYAFNKSHAAAYSVVTYQTVYLKHYYPAQFMTAVLNNRITDAKEISKYVNYLNSVGIKVLPPDINKSGVKFDTNSDGTVRFGLMAVKNVGEVAVRAVVEEREKGGDFTDLEDLIRRVDNIYINKRMIENLIKGGAFDCFGRTRSTLMASYEQIMDIVASDRKKSDNGQISLFDGLFDDDEKTLSAFSYPSLPEYREVDKLNYEKEVLGMYATGHPLNSYKAALKSFTFNTGALYLADDAAGVDDVEEEESDESGRLDITLNGQYVTIAGVLSDFQKKISKKSGKNMGYGTLEDLYGSIEAVFFSDTFEKFRGLLYDSSFVSVSGTLSLSRGERPKIMVRDVKPLANPEESASAGKPDNGKKILYVKASAKAQLGQIQRLLRLHEGETTVRVQLDNRLMQFTEKVSFSEGLLLDLELLLGSNSVLLK